MKQMGETRMLNRRELLQTAAVAAPALALTGAATARAAGLPSPAAGMNVVLFISDQDRAIQHFPDGWAEANLPGLMRLRDHGITFENAFCNACMCSPSRASLLTGYLPAQHGVKYTLEEDMPADQYPQVELPLDLKNIASVAAAAGYDVVYKGKWHLNKPAGSAFAPSDVAQYGFGRWNPPDAGANQDISQEGGGLYDHDGRYMHQQGDAAAGQEGALQYLDTVAGAKQPFLMIVSIVNPHDVLLYPKTYQDGGYDDSWLRGTIDIPDTADESLASKPRAQRVFRALSNAVGPLRTDDEKRNYLNFYGNLMKLADRYVGETLDALTRNGLLDNTLVVRTSDHGEMGMAHGGMRQKCFNAYEETLRVPLVYSNPRLWSAPATSQAMVSHIDFLPTLASLIGAPASARADWQGVDYSEQVLRRTAKAPQDYVVFTYDDYQVGQARGPYVPAPNHLVSVRERRWKIAEYYDAAGQRRSEWELYDLVRDPLERHNLAARGHKRTAAQQKQWLRMRRKLARVKAQRLRALPTTPKPQTPPGTKPPSARPGAAPAVPGAG
jgi:choline-sulfatase